MRLYYVLELVKKAQKNLTFAKNDNSINIMVNGAHKSAH